MGRIVVEDKHVITVIKRAASDLLAAAGDNRQMSKPEITAKLATMRGGRRAVADAFARAAERTRARGQAVHSEQIEARRDRLIAEVKRKAGPNGIVSRVEQEGMSTVAEAAAARARELRVRQARHGQPVVTPVVPPIIPPIVTPVTSADPNMTAEQRRARVAEVIGSSDYSVRVDALERDITGAARVAFDAAFREFHGGELDGFGPLQLGEITAISAVPGGSVIGYSLDFVHFPGDGITARIRVGITIDGERAYESMSVG
jgi:hypothetical protein